MARTAIAVSQLVRDAGVAPGSYTVLDPTNGHSVLAGKDGKMFLHVKNTATANKTITVKAGVYWRKGIGDLQVIVPASSEMFIGPLESARFEQADENIYIDVEAEATGSILAIRLP